MLIGNCYQLPILQMNLDPFDLNVSDWSSQARVSHLPTERMLSCGGGLKIAKSPELNQRHD